MQNLNNHSSNIMIDLSLLTDNIKSCSYISKSEPVPPMNNQLDKTSNFVDRVISKIDIPRVETINLPSGSKSESIVSIEENFSSDSNSNIFYS